MTDVFVVDAVRSPMGKIGGQLAFVRPDDLAAHVIKHLLLRHPNLEPHDIEDVMWGAANQAGEDNRNVGRMAALLAGLPVDVAGATVNRLCGSGMQAVISGGHALKDGWGDLMVVGGSEAMSRAPYVMLKPERALAPGTPQVEDSVLGWRFVNPTMREMYPPISLGMTAEVVAEKYGISRQQQDEFALQSHERALAAMQAGSFKDEIEELEAAQDPRGKTTRLVTEDQGPRYDTSLDILGTLPPIFKEGGTVTAGNSSPMNDGSAALLLATQTGLEKHDLRPMARIVSSAVAGVHPDVMGIGPVPATRKALLRAGLTIDEIGLIELNEAFAAQSVACIAELGFDQSIVNVNGGAIAIGHPLGASGARIITTLIHEMRRRAVGYGVATMCIGVGQGISVVVEGL